MSNEFIAEHADMFAELGGELLTVDLDAHTATVAFDNKADLDALLEMINSNLVAPLLADFTVEEIEGRHILNIESAFMLGAPS